MNGGKDIKFGHDKRPITIVEKSQENLFNIANGEILTDEFGTPLVTEVDTFFLKDATSERSTSITLPTEPSSTYIRDKHSVVGIFTAIYNTDLSLPIPTASPTTLNVLTVGSGTVGVSSDVRIGTQGATNRLIGWPNELEVRTARDYGGGETNKIYLENATNIKLGDHVSGEGIVEPTLVSRIKNGNVYLTKNVVGSGSTILGNVHFDRYTPTFQTANQKIKIQESFRETSEVSTTLLGVNRAETQLSLFSNVSSYGIDKDNFEFFSLNDGNDFGSWANRSNKIYGNRFNARRSEEVNESAIKLEAFPVPYSFPFGPKFARLGFYDADLFSRYVSFIQLGNQLYTYFDTGAGAGLGYPSDWKDKFLDPQITNVVDGDVEYNFGIAASFAAIDTWTDTWRDIKDSLLVDPVAGGQFNFSRINILISTNFDSTNTRPGYGDNNRKFAYLQSRRVFRYQPGRISGFTFGLRSSTEPVTGSIMEWGIANPTDQYVFQIDAGQLSIIRRSTVPLETSVLERNGLTIADQEQVVSGDPTDSEKYWTIKLPRDKFNGDPLNGNGPSGYLIQPNRVTMYKIEFGWYGAIGARFYAYIPTGNGGARWVTVHTLVLENSLGVPCLQDSYFRLKYSLNVSNTGDLREPQFLYKYGSSYYIDGGDEGTSLIFNATCRQKTIVGISSRTLVGITPKDFITSSNGVNIENKKLIIPTVANFSSDSLSKVEVVQCEACPGFAHVYTAGLKTGVSGRSVEIEFLDGNTITARNTTLFQESDIGAKLIAPTINNAYITAVDSPEIINGVTNGFLNATVKGYAPNSYPNYTLTRAIAGNEVRNKVTGITTTVGITTYYDPVRLSNYDVEVASDYGFTGSKIEVNYLNPGASDNGHFADFMVGITDSTPLTSLPNTLTGFNVGGSNVSSLPNENILFTEHTHRYCNMDEDAVETGEVWGARSQFRQNIDFRLPKVNGIANGNCQRVTFDVQKPTKITGLTLWTYKPNVPSDNINRPIPTYYIRVEGQFPANIDYNEGQIAIDVANEPVVLSTRFIGSPVSYFEDGILYQYIRIDSEITGLTGINPSSQFNIFIRPITMSTGGSSLQTSTKSKLYNFIPYPLFLVFKLKDNAVINNISVREVIGNTQKTIAPRFYVSGIGEVSNADGNANIIGTPPTNFRSLDRLSSARVDTQNEQNLRPGIVKDTIFVGANETTQVDMGKVFGQDRNVITPDNNNTSAVFFTAKKIDSGASGTMEASISYKEQ